MEELEECKVKLEKKIKENVEIKSKNESLKIELREVENKVDELKAKIKRLENELSDRDFTIKEIKSNDDKIYKLQVESIKQEYELQRLEMLKKSEKLIELQQKYFLLEKENGVFYFRLI